MTHDQTLRRVVITIGDDEQSWLGVCGDCETMMRRVFHMEPIRMAGDFPGHSHAGGS